MAEINFNICVVLCMLLLLLDKFFHFSACNNNNNNNNNLFEFLKQKNAFVMKFIDTQLILQLSTKWGNTKYGEQGLGSLAEK